MRRFVPSAWLLVAASGCAASPVLDELNVPPIAIEESEPDEEPEADPDGELGDKGTGDDEDEGEEDEDDDAADTGIYDAGLVVDAGTMADAGADAGRDAGRRGLLGGLLGSRAADQASDVARDILGSCMKATDCKNTCVPLGITNCCRADMICGCTWAPGAYCL